MAPVERRQARQMRAQLRHVLRDQTIVFEPPPPEYLDRCVMGVRLFVIVLQPGYELQRVRRCRITRFAQAREQAPFFIGGVLWCGHRE